MTDDQIVSTPEIAASAQTPATPVAAPSDDQVSYCAKLLEGAQPSSGPQLSLYADILREAPAADPNAKPYVASTRKVTINLLDDVRHALIDAVEKADGDYDQRRDAGTILRHLVGIRTGTTLHEPKGFLANASSAEDILVVLASLAAVAHSVPDKETGQPYNEKYPGGNIVLRNGLSAKTNPLHDPDKAVAVIQAIESQCRDKGIVLDTSSEVVRIRQKS